ncbi:kelch-like protein 10 [Odontesthes bonariensis]|uniref:kelch-like protein 10 n=1 Tax=Odontesthes bonariensis TaxID=219752 RepID=UPI003F58F0D9
MSENVSVYNELRLRQQLCDALIRAESVEFFVHKVILCNCSSYFRTLFTQWSTPDCYVFDIPNVAPHLMNLIIEFAYTGFIPVTPENIQELFVIADRFNVMGILHACGDFFDRQLTPQTCIGIWLLTDTYYYPEMIRKAFQIILNSFEEVLATSEEFPLLSVQHLVKIIQSDHLIVRQEETVFEAIMQWIAFAPEERREHSSLLLSNVRLALMSPDYITDNVVDNEVVKSNQECRMIVLKILEPFLDHMTSSYHKSTACRPLVPPRLPPALLLAIGGWSNGSPTNFIEAYDVRIDSWVNVAHTEQTPRAYHGAVFLDGSVYCVGGFDGVKQFSSVHRLELGTHTWQEVSPMHSSRCFVSVTVLDGYIYALGGYNGHERLQTAERYEPRSNQWTLIAPMHEHRSDASCTTLHGRVYICGGFNGRECLSSAECYNPYTNQWTLIASMGSKRSGIGVITYDKQIFAVGGFNGTKRLSSAEAYDPLTCKWHNMPSMLTPRSNFGISVINDRLFVVGGYSGVDTIFDVEFYDVRTHEWFDARDMEISRSALSCCVVSGNMAYYAATFNPPELQLPREEADEMEE